jgi:hypothetical protein
MLLHNLAASSTARRLIYNEDRQAYALVVAIPYVGAASLRVVLYTIIPWIVKFGC